MTYKTNRTIVLVAIATLLVSVIAVTYADQQEQEHYTDASNVHNSVGNTEKDKTNPENNTTKIYTKSTLTHEEFNMRVNKLVGKISGLYFENDELYATASNEGALDRQTLNKIAQNNQTIQIL